jgi:aspartokinase
LETRETVAGIVHDLDVSRVTLTGIRTGPGTMSRIFAPLAEAGVSVDVIVESAPKEGHPTWPSRSVAPVSPKRTAWRVRSPNLWAAGSREKGTWAR